MSTLPAAAGSAGGCGPTWVGETDSFYPSLSGDGRLVTFLAQLPPLPGSDELNDSREVLMRDVVRRKTFQVSHSQLPYGSATGHEISADGRRVAYALRPNLFENDTELKVYDTRRHRTTSEGWVGVNTPLSLSRTGRRIAYLLEDSNGKPDVVVRDVITDRVTPVSVTPSGRFGNGSSVDPSISPDGRYVAFTSYASNLVPEDTDSQADLFLRDLRKGRTTLLSDYRGGPGAARFAPDGRFLLSLEPTAAAYRYDIRTGKRTRVYHSRIRPPVSTTTDRGARHLVTLAEVPGSPGRRGLSLLDLRTGKRQLITVPVRGRRYLGESYGAVVSSNGRYVAFYSTSDDLVKADKNGLIDVFVRDLRARKTMLVSRPTAHCRISLSR